MHAMQISREPMVRKKLREEFRKRLRFSAHPTKKGIVEIDHQHPLFGKQYIFDKPVGRMEADEYLYYAKAEKEGLIETRLYVDTDDEIKRGVTLMDTTIASQYKRDEFSAVAVEWNNLRREVMKTCVDEILVPIFRKEAHELLMEEAQGHVIRTSAEKLTHQLAIAAFVPAERYVDENDDDEAGHRVVSICYSSDRDMASFAAVIDQDGMVVDYARLSHFTRRANSRFSDESKLKLDDMNTLRQMIVRSRPHAIFLGGEDLQAFYLCKELRQLADDIDMSRDLPVRLPVELIDTEVPKAYMKCKMAEVGFLRQPLLWDFVYKNCL